MELPGGGAALDLLDLPVVPVLDLAEQMGVAPNTVRPALRVLRDEGLIYSVPGRGTFVRECER